MTAVTTATSASTLLVGFDSAWTRENRGALVAVLMRGDGTKYVCAPVCEALADHGLPMLAAWSEQARAIAAPRKRDQDALDACLCLLVALHLAHGRECLAVGDIASGYILVPHGNALHAELEARCGRTGREPAQWLRRIGYGRRRAAGLRACRPRV